MEVFVNQKGLNKPMMSIIRCLTETLKEGSQNGNGYRGLKLKQNFLKDGSQVMLLDVQIRNYINVSCELLQELFLK